MGYYYFKCRSVTYAQRASKFLYGKGVYTSITKLPLKYSREGCGYSLRVSERQFKIAFGLLQSMGFEISQVFFSKDGNNYEEVSL